MKKIIRKLSSPFLRPLDNRITFLSQRLDHIQGLIEAARREIEESSVTNRALADVIEANSMTLARIRRELNLESERKFSAEDEL